MSYSFRSASAVVQTNTTELPNSTDSSSAKNATGTERAFDVSNHFDQELFSDVTVRFSGREVKAHKLILCSQSEYFLKLCGPDSRFAEANQNVVKLEGDDEHAVQAMLTWLYTFNYLQAKPDEIDQTVFNLNVYTTADKYGLVSLRGRVVENMKPFLSKCDCTALIDLVQRIYCDDERIYYEDLTGPVNSAVNEQLQQLMEQSAFTDILRSKEDLAVTILKNRIAKGEPIHLEEGKVVRYSCGHPLFLGVADIVEPSCPRGRCPGSAPNVRKCWLK